MPAAHTPGALGRQLGVGYRDRKVAEMSDPIRSQRMLGYLAVDFWKLHRLPISSFLGFTITTAFIIQRHQSVRFDPVTQQKVPIFVTSDNSSNTLVSTLFPGSNHTRLPKWGHYRQFPPRPRLHRRCAPRNAYPRCPDTTSLLGSVPEHLCCR